MEGFNQPSSALEAIKKLQEKYAINVDTKNIQLDVLLCVMKTRIVNFFIYNYGRCFF